MQQQSLEQFLAAVAAKSPTPGGGAVASVTAGLATALGQMVLHYSRGKKSLAQHEGLHQRAMQQLEDAAARALQLADADAEAYGNLSALWKLDQADPHRVEHWGACVAAAIAAPKQIMQMCMDVLALLEELVGTTSAMLKSDLAIAAVLAEAALRSGAWNVRVNLPLLEDAVEAERLADEMQTLLAEGQRVTSRIETACRA